MGVTNEDILKVVTSNAKVIRDTNKRMAELHEKMAKAREVQDKFTPQLIGAMDNVTESMRAFTISQSETLATSINQMLTTYEKSLEIIVKDRNKVPVTAKIVLVLVCAILFLVCAVVGPEVVTALVPNL